MGQLAKAATPFAAGFDRRSCGPDQGCLPMAGVTLMAAGSGDVAAVSSLVTTGWVAQVWAVSAPPLGWVLKTSWLAAPAVMLKALLKWAWPAPSGSRGQGVRPPTCPVILQPAKEAVPPVVVSGLVVHASVPPPQGLVPTARVMEAVPPVTALPPTSWTVTAGCLAHVAALVPPPGWVVKATWVAGPTERSTKPKSHLSARPKSRGQRIGPGLADNLATGKGIHSGRSRQWVGGAGERGAIAGLAGDRQRHRIGGGGHYVAAGVFEH